MSSCGSKKCWNLPLPAFSKDVLKNQCIYPPTSNNNQNDEPIEEIAHSRASMERILNSFEQQQEENEFTSSSTLTRSPHSALSSLVRQQSDGFQNLEVLEANKLLLDPRLQKRASFSNKFTPHQKFTTALASDKSNLPNDGKKQRISRLKRKIEELFSKNKEKKDDLRKSCSSTETNMNEKFSTKSPTILNELKKHTEQNSSKRQKTNDSVNDNGNNKITDNQFSLSSSEVAKMRLRFNRSSEQKDLMQLTSIAGNKNKKNISDEKSKEMKRNSSRYKKKIQDDSPALRSNSAIQVKNKNSRLQRKRNKSPIANKKAVDIVGKNIAQSIVSLENHMETHVKQIPILKFHKTKNSYDSAEHANWEPVKKNDEPVKDSRKQKSPKVRKTTSSGSRKRKNNLSSTQSESKASICDEEDSKVCKKSKYCIQKSSFENPNNNLSLSIKKSPISCVEISADEGYTLRKSSANASNTSSGQKKINYAMNNADIKLVNKPSSPQKLKKNKKLNLTKFFDLENSSEINVKQKLATKRKLSYPSLQKFRDEFKSVSSEIGTSKAVYKQPVANQLTEDDGDDSASVSGSQGIETI